jgi:lysyl-tRNA synthetase class 2
MTIKIVRFKESSFIKNLSWHQDSGSLFVAFNSGTTWVYYDVPESIVQDLLKASSTGSYFNKMIRDKYPSQRINYKFLQDGSEEQKETQA